MKVVLLAGGFGTRIADVAGNKPKPMVEIGGMPILWHIMKEYSHYGFNDFIICGGFKQEIIKEWFSNYFLRQSDITFDYTNGKNDVIINKTSIEPWKVTIVDTGLATLTGSRIKRIEPYIGKERFMMTYGDGVCDVNITELVKFHEAHGKIATITAVVQKQNKGIIQMDGNNAVKSFREKNIRDGALINAGYMVLEPEIFDYLKQDDCVFEQKPLTALADKNELMCYTHHGFWQCMDDRREMEILENLWATNEAPWKVWK